MLVITKRRDPQGDCVSCDNCRKDILISYMIHSDREDRFAGESLLFCSTCLKRFAKMLPRAIEQATKTEIKIHEDKVINIFKSSSAKRKSAS